LNQFFSLDFFMNIFLKFHHFTFNYLHLSFVIFSLFLLFDYFKSESLKLTRINSSFYLMFFFYWTLVFFTRLSFWKKIFLSQFHIKNYWFIKLPRANSIFFLWRCIFKSFFFLFSFDIRLLGLKLYNFLFVFLRVLLISYLWLLFS
jgi:hypothetical protein